jgi:membrane protein DedA with SNARE-associated domain
MALMVNLLNSLPLIESFGLLGIYFIIFAESGLFFGFFFPGDSLLFTAGLLSSEGRLSFWALIIGAFMAGVLGNQVGYLFGKRVGGGLFIGAAGGNFKNSRGRFFSPAPTRSFSTKNTFRKRKNFLIDTATRLLSWLALYL